MRPTAGDILQGKRNWSLASMHGHDTTEVLNVLSTLRTTQALHEADVARILGELGQ